MRHAIGAAIGVVATVVLWNDGTHAQSTETLFRQLNDFRMFTVRRHTDAQVIDLVFDDYRKNWLRRQNSTIRLGDRSTSLDDMPVCDNSGPAGYLGGKECGNGFVARAFATGLAAQDRKNGADIRETGGLAYVGYEYLVSNDFFLGVGFSGLGSTINNRAGQGLKADVTEYAGHLLGGYRINDSNMLAWNITYVRSANSTTRNGNITADFGTDSIFLNGVWFRNIPLTGSAFVSLGLDYTLQFTIGQEVVESNGVSFGRFPGIKEQYQGDFTGSALFVQPLDRAELFARAGLTWRVLNAPNRTVDVPLDVGAAVRITDKVAFVGSVGATYLFPHLGELRGNVRLTGRF